jgi:hypothetical protein
MLLVRRQELTMNTRVLAVAAALVSVVCVPAVCVQGFQPAEPGGKTQSAPAGHQAGPQPGAAEFGAANEAFQREEWKVAAEQYGAALAKGFDLPMLHFRFGYALHVLGKTEEALGHHILGAKVTHPRIRVDCLYNAACASALLGRKDEALAFFQRAIDAGMTDTAQIEKDADLESLRGDERFKAFVAGIGKTPTLSHQLDFMLGSWDILGPDGTIIERLVITRPLAGSSALASTATQPSNAFGAHAGLLVPNFETRTWSWTFADGFGTTTVLTGAALEAGGIRLAGRTQTPVGPGTHVRLTFTPTADERVKEIAEVCEDGVSWRTHHEVVFAKAKPGDGESEESSEK